MAKKVTIKDIADMAGVSIATVSHVINRRLKVGRQSEIVAVIPNVESTIYRDMVGYLKKYVSIQGYQF